MAFTSQNVEKSQNSLSLEDILLAFNNPVNEEQAWSVCYQCAQYFQNLETQSVDRSLKYHELYKYGKRALKFSKDGSVFIEYSEISRGTGKGPPGKLKRKNSVTGKDIKIVTENDAIQALGLVIYQALDYGLGDNEERHLGRDLEHLLELMINPDEDDETFNADDEGIEKDAKESCTFQEITVLCIRHLTSQQDASHHYKAVCRAFAAEAQELTTFLDKITCGHERLAETQLDQDLQRLDNLQRADWARLWVQMMRELRQGCRLKKVEHTHLPPLEYELTPFEILLEDIRTRRYTLNKILVNGDIPNTVKSDAHAVMLDFIRSRPPLQPAKDRVLKSPPKKELTAREQILLHIRSKPQLKSVRDERHVVETSRTKLNNDNADENPQPVRKVIKPDFNLLLDSFEDDEDDDTSTLSPKSRRSSVATPSPEIEVPQWRRTVVRDVVTQERHCVLQRRNTITVCESPQVSPTSPEKDVSSSHREHESKLKRSGPVSKSNACLSDLRKRLNEKLHGCSSVSRLHSRRLHGSISEVPSETENNESLDKQKFETVKSESRSIPRRISSSGRSLSSVQNKSGESSADSTSLKHSKHIEMHKTGSDTSALGNDCDVRKQRKPPENMENSRLEQRKTSEKIENSRLEQRKTSEKIKNSRLEQRKTSENIDNSRLEQSKTLENMDNSRLEQRKTSENIDNSRLEQRKTSENMDNSRLEQRKTSENMENSRLEQRKTLENSERHRRVLRTTSHRIRKSVSQDYSENNISNTSNGTESPQPHSPRIMIPKRSSSPVSQSSPSITSPVKTHVSTCFAGLTEISSSPIKMHVSTTKHMHENACSNQSDNSDISLGKSLPSRRILVSRRSSMPVSKSCNDLGLEKTTTDETLHRTQSVIDIDSQKPKPKPRPRLSKCNSLSLNSAEPNNSLATEKVQKSQTEKLSTEVSNPPKPVPRPRTKIVQRSHSQRPVSTDLSHLSAIKSSQNNILENGVNDSKVGNHLTSQKNNRSETPDLSRLRSESPSMPQLSELDVNELLNVSLSTRSVPAVDTNNSSVVTTPCQDSRSDSKWKHPIECLALNLEEVMHIRTVLTKAELESLILEPELYNMVSKGKVCFTCKEVKFSMFGQWGNKCKICNRNVCNTCLRKMNIPTEHFQNIPVHTLSPIPLSPEALDILKVFESTGSVPHSPLTQKKLLQEIENKSPKKKTLQRSQTFNSTPNLATPLPNKNLLKGPQMNVCCECKKMIMDIIRTSRTSISLINKGKTLPSSEDRKSASSLSLSVKNFFTLK